MQRIIFIFAILAACQAGPQKEVTVKTTPATPVAPKKKPSSKSTYEITTLQSANGWAYRISQNGKLVIDQPTIPGRPGNLGFQTEEDAIKVAELVKAKLQAKVFPPSISEADLQNLNIH